MYYKIYTIAIANYKRYNNCQFSQASQYFSSFPHQFQIPISIMMLFVSYSCLL